TSELPEEEMMTEPSDPLRDELLALYERAENNEKPQPEPDGNKVNIANMQANMFSYVSNIEPDEFKVVIYKKIEG
ncbi:14381_t:CDS:1, partial [Gigaspora margarita]